MIREVEMIRIEKERSGCFSFLVFYIFIVRGIEDYKVSNNRQNHKNETNH
jgi:hypothetical protein